jgi:hypothetical protein
MNNVPACLEEMKRADRGDGRARHPDLHQRERAGLWTSPEFTPIFERMRGLRPAHLAASRRAAPSMTGLRVEQKSTFEIWWLFGWPYETSAACARMVFSGFFDRWPNLKIITHHMGAMIPYLENRIGMGMDQMGTRTGGDGLQPAMSRATWRRRASGPWTTSTCSTADTFRQRVRPGDPLRARLLRPGPLAFRHGLPVRIRRAARCSSGKACARSASLATSRRDSRQNSCHGNAERLLRLDQPMACAHCGD